ncbi:MAG: protease complex subunit PrcB family protein [Trueperaceae bacterium]|nr:protease complex subunit PrcB family protein [Trueperaceae bacterium]
MKYLGFLFLLFLMGCVPEVDSSLKLHELVLFSNGQDLNKRLLYFYGGPQDVTLGQEQVQLEEPSPNAAEGFSVENALLANGEPNLSRQIDRISPPPTRVQRIPLTTEVQLEVGARVAEVIYFDGLKWFTLVGEAEPGFVTRLVPKERINGLVGAGSLTREEAQMLMRVLEPRGALAVTVVPNPAVSPRKVDGVEEYLQTALYVQLTLPTDIAAYTPPAEDLIWEELASGNQAVGVDKPEYVFISNETQFLNVWNKAYGSQLSVPALPDINFDKETLLAVFMGQKNSGGYGITIQDVSNEQTDIYVNMKFNEPAPGTMTTQALSSPWVILRVLRGDVNAAWFRDPASSELFAVARR